MKCLMCGGGMTTARGTYRYKESGLNVTLVNVEIRRCPSCGEEEVNIPAIDGLHRAIALMLVKKKAPLASSEVRFLREYLGWTGENFAKHMGVSRFQVSRWESGSAAPSAVADRLVRALVMMKSPVDDYNVDGFAKLGEKSKSKPRLAALKLRHGRRDWEFADAAE